MSPCNWTSVAVIALSLLLPLSSCKKDDSYSVKERSYEGFKKLVLEEDKPSPSPPEKGTSDPTDRADIATGPEWVIVDNVSKVAEAVLKESQQATKDGKKLVVYVSAVWCKPCKDFSEATKRAGFGSELNHIRLMKFDWDRHQTPLARAGYGSQFLPLFVVPGPDGKASEKQHN